MNTQNNIILIGNYPHDRQESMQRFSAVLLQGLKAKGHFVKLVQPDPVFGKLKPGSTGIGKWLGYIDKFILFPFTLRRLVRKQAESGNTVVHICDHSNAMFASSLKELPLLVTCNDMLAIRSALGEFPENKTKWTGRILQKWILRSLRGVPRIACISTATQEDAFRLAGRNATNSAVIYMGLNYPYQPLDKATRNGVLHKLQLSRGLSINLVHPFLFHVGGSKWYKNRDGLIRIYAEMRRMNPSIPQLVIAGKPHSEKVQDLIRRENLEQSVHYIGEVSNKELNALYSAAEVFLFPSLAEGFGWPIIEAQSSACRIVTSKRKPMTEIGGESALYVDPETPGEAAADILGLLNEPLQERDIRIQTGIRNSARFSTRKMIDEYILEYEKL